MVQNTRSDHDVGSTMIRDHLQNVRAVVFTKNEFYII